MFRSRRNKKPKGHPDLHPDPRWHPRQVKGRDRAPDPENRMIDLEDVHLAFGDKVVLDGVWLEVDRGETLVVMGGSGQGKSTILKIVLALLEPDGGRVYVHGVDVTHANQEVLGEVRRDIGMVFQGGALFDSLTVGENLGFRLREEGGHDDDEIERLVEEKLSFVNLEPEVANLMPAELSGGMRKRVALARAIMGSPRIVLYDEPTTGLDPITSETINELINKLRDQQNVASVVVTHDIGSALVVGDRFAMLKEGKIIFEGSGPEVLETDDDYIRMFIDARMKGA
ncbi:MAG TPA: ATP-binding cassette domain-containing protein [Gemmatimonadota bacterium]|nr:ATP-binding cassette domain-containing protein [Gemmatimonadota bacterium]